MALSARCAPVYVRQCPAHPARRLSCRQSCNPTNPLCAAPLCAAPLLEGVAARTWDACNLTVTSCSLGKATRPKPVTDIRRCIDPRMRYKTRNPMCVERTQRSIPTPSREGGRKVALGAVMFVRTDIQQRAGNPGSDSGWRIAFLAPLLGRKPMLEVRNQSRHLESLLHRQSPGSAVVRNFAGKQALTTASRFLPPALPALLCHCHTPGQGSKPEQPSHPHVHQTRRRSSPKLLKILPRQGVPPFLGETSGPTSKSSLSAHASGFASKRIRTRSAFTTRRPSLLGQGVNGLLVFRCIGLSVMLLGATVVVSRGRRSHSRQSAP